ncbi:putative sterigmatocystin biosynthesis monooxygenase stcW [Lasiodiplodia hormozganensis]|uniref:Sterigmatocystin biosynthesis monooxygenase stcW n=1 Tax=Lasiodiplodia hormozganensis TaxID=869390 RepID=A0AA39YAJ1_9PEZI|nr:putative sterigmatocystin biosynthesis monooxygenase stcW [Lasiodiplodia hormozganensis]
MQQFRDDPIFSVKTRKEMENHFNGMFKAFFKSTEEQQDLRARFELRMKNLIKDEDLQKKLIPSFEVGCRRINPGESYLVALQKQNVQAVFEPIEAIAKEGILVGGHVRRADVLIAATGFDTTFRPRFPIIGRENNNLQDLWESNPVSYMGTGVAGFPNYLMFLGPNTPISNGSLMGSLEATSDYFIRMLRKVLREDVKTFDVVEAAQRDFDTHTQSFMRQTVWTGACRSWFKSGPGGKVTALWPGSSLHYMQVLAENKWENYSWTYRGNRFAHWGKGMSWIEDPSGDGLGIDASEALRSRTIPFKGADLSYYISECEPLSVDDIDDHAGVQEALVGDVHI